MHPEESTALSFAMKHYGITGAIKKLHSEVDLNYYIKATDEKKYILKIANVKQKKEHLEFQNAVIDRLSNKTSGLEVSQLVPSLSGEFITTISFNGEKRLMRLLTWVDGRVFAEVNPHTVALLEHVGEMCGKLCLALQGFDHPEAHRFYKWDPSQADWIGDHHILFADPERKEIVTYFFEKYTKEVKPKLSTLRKSVNYNDANDYNILISHDAINPTVPGVIDFGDAIYTNTINELAIALAYILMHKPDPLAAAFPVVKGFHQTFPIKEEELEVLFTLIAIRLATSVTCSVINLEEHPENTYLQISDQPAWDLLKKLRNISPALAHYTFRHACGLEPHPNKLKFMKWAVANIMIRPLVSGFDPDNIHWLDLSVGSHSLGNYENILDANKLNRKVQSIMDEAGVSYSVGKYNEVRGIYTTDSFATEGNHGPEWRTVHIGLDFFAKAGTNVIVPISGTIHSIADNNNDRDYGPTIILKHKVSNDLTFYTLYGHLDRGSLAYKDIGKTIYEGSILGRVGDMKVNGGWPPHLHFQIMLDDLGKQGDFPGVANESQIEIWKSICPDPMVLYNHSYNTKQDKNKEALLAYRKEHLGKNLSLSYRKPLHMVRGVSQYLIDATGRRYLDTVNNVAHVGHEHPRVVAAGQRQMAVLNTNTRYLHKNIIAFAEAIIETMPAELNVVYVVNSGSEANELALRMAKNYTQQKDMIVVETGYHGNTNACVEISSYKFDGKGGTGAEPHIHVVPMPDTFRGLHRDQLTAGKDYSNYITKALAKIQSTGKNVAAFICESVLSCGGQIVLPENYLKNSYALVRNAGGVCIADEVQTGCGRAGNHFWAFQEHDVVPDIVTIGKPIGNGHPLGVVVTTQKIANAFKNGMEYFNTFGGNPVSSAIGLAVLKIIKEEGLQENALTTGNYLKTGLHELMRQFPIIGDVRGPGLFLGIELIKDNERTPATEEANYLANRMRELGILMSTDGPHENVLKIKPPIIFSKNDANFLLSTLNRVLKEDFLNQDS